VSAEAATDCRRRLPNPKSQIPNHRNFYPLLQAATTLKLQKRHREAAWCYRRAADLHGHASMGAEGRTDRAQALVEAGKALGRALEAGLRPCCPLDPRGDANNPSSEGPAWEGAEGVARLLGGAADVFLALGRAQQAARYIRDIADVHGRGGDGAAEERLLLRAADLFDGEGSTADADRCLSRAAALAASGAAAGPGGRPPARAPRPAHAAALFERVARSSQRSHLLRFGTRNHLLDAFLCLLGAGDLGAAQSALGDDPADADAAGAGPSSGGGGPLGGGGEAHGGAPGRFHSLDPTFVGSREEGFCRSLLRACAAADPDALSAAVGEWDSVSRLEPWKTTMLLGVKRRLEAAGAGRGAPGGWVGGLAPGGEGAPPLPLAVPFSAPAGGGGGGEVDDDDLT